MQKVDFIELRGSFFRASAYQVVPANLVPVPDITQAELGFLRTHNARVAPTKDAKIASVSGQRLDPADALTELFGVLRLYRRWVALPDDAAAIAKTMKARAKVVNRRRQRFGAGLGAWCTRYGLLGLLPYKLGRGSVSCSEIPRYFVEVPDPLPVPEDAAFWRSYREPVVEIMDMAERLHGLSHALATGEGLASAAEEINRLAGGHRPIAVVDTGQMTIGYAADSLLSLLVSALLHAPTLGYRFQLCAAEDCRIAFVAPRSDREYCSGRCRKRLHARKTRAA